MSSPNQNHEPVQLDDLSNRMVDVALAELVGGHAPPDLSNRISAENIRQTASARPAPRTRKSRAFWASLAVAAVLLIGVTMAVLPAFQSAGVLVRKTSQSMDRRGNVEHRHQIKDDTQSVEALGERLTTIDDVSHKITISDGTSAPESESGSLQLSKDVPLGVRALAPTDRRAGPEGAPAIAPATPPSSAPSDKKTLLKMYGGTQSLSTTRSVANKSGTQPADVALLTDSDRLSSRHGSLEVRAGVRFGQPGQTAEGTGPGLSGDQYTRIVENPFVKTEGGAAVSTFSIDVDTASYSNVRQFLMEMNQLPPPDAVRIEELINYFRYDYAGPGVPAVPFARNAAMAGAQVEAVQKYIDAPFAAHVEVAGCPWAPEHRLVRIGVKGRELDPKKRPQSNLVFLIDVSGSMDEPAKLPLVIYGLEQLTRELGENDRVAIVVYASSEGLVLPSTPGTKQEIILAALAKLKAGGSTAGGAGIQLAYQIAEDNFIKGGVNRVILCTDGDFNVGVTSTGELQRLVEKKAKDTGVFLSALGFGRGNLNDSMMEAISNHGNGNYHYVDNRSEARRVLVEQMTGTLVTIAKDVKIQVEFNPAQVAGYRLIGYEDRMLRTEDFNDDKKDAGEIGAGHTVTALYEIVPAGKKVDVGPVDDLKYQKNTIPVKVLSEKAQKGSKVANNDYTEFSPGTLELLTLKMRYKAPDGDTSKKLEWPITDDGKAFAAASADTKFASAVAGFGMLLRDSQYKGNLTFAAVLELAQGGVGDDPHGYRKEFLEMVRRAKELRHE
jgi:Ca-activated chloride channel family protein